MLKLALRKMTAALVLLLVSAAAEATVYCRDKTTGACSVSVFGSTCPEGFEQVTSCATPTPAVAADQWCWNGGTNCAPYKAGDICFGQVISTCPPASVTPVPIATPTPRPGTPTPTPTPAVYTVGEFLKSRDLGYTYVMALTMLDGVVWGNGGVCCPGIGDGIGECLFSIDYMQTPPIFREWVCTYRDSNELWEITAPQVARSDSYKWVVAGEATRRAALPALVKSGTASLTWGFGVQSLTERFFTWTQNVGRLFYPEFLKRWPLAILDLDGIRYLYCMTLKLDGPTAGQFALERYAWPSAYHVALYTQTTSLGVLPVPLSPIAIDVDGSLLSTIDVETTASASAAGVRASALSMTAHAQWYPSGSSTKVLVMRSLDQGRSWSETGLVIQAPAGKALWGCGFEHKSGGAAVQPLHLLCTLAPLGKGPETGEHIGADVRFASAKVPASWGQKPVLWVK